MMKSCEVAKRNVDAAGKQMLIVSGGNGLFFLPLPEAQDWMFQCDAERPFWAFSKTARMQVTVRPYQAPPEEDLTMRAYLMNIGRNMKTNLTAEGVRVSNANVSTIYKGEQGDIQALEMALDAPAGQPSPLFPQDAYYTARQVAERVMVDVHLTTYPRDAKESESLRSSARVVMGSFTINVAGNK